MVAVRMVAVWAVDDKTVFFRMAAVRMVSVRMVALRMVAGC
jgi:hypothetical protein